MDEILKQQEKYLHFRCNYWLSAILNRATAYDPGIDGVILTGSNYCIIFTTKNYFYSMKHTDIRIDNYIEKVADFAKPIMTHLRELIHKTCPDVEETWKWSFPNFMYKGSILCSMAAFKEHCSFGFWKASLLQNDDAVLSIKEKEGMGHLGKIESLADLPPDAVLAKYIKAAMKLNEDGVKPPPRPKTIEKIELNFPADFTEALQKNKKASEVFNAFSYSAKKEYWEWFTEAKTPATLNKRIGIAVDWIEEGKSRNWKYKNC